MESCDRSKGGVCAEEEKSILIIERGKRRTKGVCSRAAKKRVYPTIKITIDGAGILCREEGWKEANSAGLQVFE